MFPSCAPIGARCSRSPSGAISLSSKAYCDDPTGNGARSSPAGEQRPIGSVDVELLKEHLKEADVDAGVLFGAADFEPDALTTAEDAAVALLRVTDGRTAFDTSGWGTPGHYPAWLPAYCAQSVKRDPLGQPRYELLESGQGGVIVERLRTPAKERRNA